MSVPSRQELDLAREYNHPLEPVRPEAASLMESISRAASDPNTNVDKLERLWLMYERMQAHQAKQAYIAALVAVKPLLPVIDRRGRIVITDKATHKEIIQSTPYALWEDIDEKITPVLNQHGLALTFRSGVAQDGKITVTGILSHKEGHSEDTTITLPHDSSGSKNAVQAVGSSTSYGKRYTATLLLNIRTRGEDDDGKEGGAAKIKDAQLTRLRGLIDETETDLEKFCAFLKVDSLADISSKDFDRAVIALEAKKKRK